MKRALGVAFAALVGACAVDAFRVASAQTPPVSGSYCRSPGLSIPDGDANGVTDTITVSDSFRVGDLDVSLQVDHTWVNDLVITIEHVDTNKSATLISRPNRSSGGWCPHDDIEATFDDEAASTPTCNSPPPAIAGDAQPLSPLSVFDGDDVSGTWRIRVVDAIAGDSGTLVSWCLFPTPNTYAHCRAPGIAIPDFGGRASDTITLSDAATIEDLDVSLQVDHTFVGDLVASLTHVDTGSTATIIKRPPCGNDDIDATFDDESANDISCVTTNPAIGGDVKPDSPLAVFDGELLSGTWRINVSDQELFETGSLVAWCLLPTATPLKQPMHIGDLDGFVKLNATRWRARVRIAAHNRTHGPVAGATVTGTWSSGGVASSSCVTDSRGHCTLVSGPIKRSIETVTFTVTSLSKLDRGYHFSMNHDPDGDSDGTTIDVHQ